MTGKVRKISVAELNAETRWFKAFAEYLNWNDRTRLDELIETEEFIPKAARVFLKRMALGEVKRPQGQPPKIRYTDEQVVQLVLKAKLQAGCGFDNKNGDEGNESFCFVAENLGVTPGFIRRKYSGVSKERRDRIESWLRESLRDAGALAEGRQ